MPKHVAQLVASLTVVQKVRSPLGPNQSEAIFCVYLNREIVLVVHSCSGSISPLNPYLSNFLKDGPKDVVLCLFSLPLPLSSRDELRRPVQHARPGYDDDRDEDTTAKMMSR
jgi:hypothetical protein